MRLTVSADTPGALQVAVGKRLTKRPGDSPARRVAQAEPGAKPERWEYRAKLRHKPGKVYRLSKATPTSKEIRQWGRINRESGKASRVERKTTHRSKREASF